MRRHLGAIGAQPPALAFRAYRRGLLERAACSWYGGTAQRGPLGGRDDAADVVRDVARSHSRITDAPLVVLIWLSMANMDCYPDARRRQPDYMMAVQSTAMATQNLLLAAHARAPPHP